MKLTTITETILIILFSLFYSLFAQTDSTVKYITIVPGAEYKAGWVREMFFGAHWRDVWTTPIKVEILDLDKFAGGLIPVKRGGGKQTKSLRFKGADGQQWKFRSVNKDPSKILPPNLQESIAEDIVQDQISTSNPFAPLIVFPLLEEVNLIEAKAQLVFLPDVEKLGEFREEFGGLLGFIEVHPNEGENDEPGFAGAIDVKGTYKLLNHIEKKRNEKINAKEFLKARLMDILLGDWDRHMDQWRWAKYDEDERDCWYPIPRDRDQAFSKYDGFFPSIAAYLVPQLNDFDYDYPQIKELTWNGRFLDRRVLTELDKPTWDSITTVVKNNITNSIIDMAVKRLPPEVYSICAEELIAKLKSRRDKLQDASDEYYTLVNKFADVYCSTKNDYVEVNRLSDLTTEVTVYKRGKKSGDKKGKPVFHKVFDNEITIDVRIFLNDGDDKAVVRGESNYSPVVRIIGGKGEDELIDESVVHGYFLSITPFTAIQKRTYFYDSDNNTIVTSTAGTDYDDHLEPEPKDDGEKYEPPIIDRGHRWLPIPVFGFDTDNGITVGAGVQLSKYNFREKPVEYVQQIIGGYSSIGGVTIKYNGDFYSLAKHSRLNVKVIYSTLFAIRYFGFGNETSFSNDLNNNHFYRVDQELFTIFPMFYYNFSQNYVGRVGFSFIYTDTEMNNEELLDDFTYGTYGLSGLNPLGLHAGFEIDNRDNVVMPTNGFYADFRGGIFPKVFNLDAAFYRAGIDVRTYLPFNLFKGATLAMRAGGEKIWGKYPFYAAAFLGGIENLRGYNRWRFSGDASLFGQAEARIWLTKMKVLFKTNFGINLFAEAGRVFVQGDNQDSKKWHPSYGAGLWLSYLENTVVITTYAAISPDRVTFNFGFSMAY
jgi:Omp85 superfamily domain